jgi:ferrous iron transport protein A
MNLLNLEPNQKATIVAIQAQSPLKERLLSFGVVRGEEVTLKSFSLGKQTVEIEVGSTLLALRADEAKKIEVK